MLSHVTGVLCDKGCPRGCSMISKTGNRKKGLELVAVPMRPCLSKIACDEKERMF